MATPPLSYSVALESIEAVEKAKGDVSAAARILGIADPTLRSRLRTAERVHKLKPNVKASSEKYIKQLEREIAELQKESVDAQALKRIIGEAAVKSASVQPPNWLVKPGKAGAPGVPMLFLSDLHWGEVVHPAQINNVNKYNLAIAKQRLRDCFETTVTLLDIISPTNDYPGIVIPLGGDMVSGDIHEELADTNELHTIPTVLDLQAELTAIIKKAADQYGRVFLPCVTGNHGRNTKKIRAKDRHHTSFDWMLYQLLAQSFAGDKRVTFQIPDGPDALFRLYGTTYNLTHGDQFRGGDGMIGHIGPITRGDHKKRSRNSAIGREYNILMMGHWHQYLVTPRLLVNGSLKGYDEYANQNNFGFEPPVQSLHLTHPQHGVTFRMPVYVDRTAPVKKVNWVAIPSAA